MHPKIYIRMNTDGIVSWEQFDSITDNGAPDFMEIYREFLQATPGLFSALKSAIGNADEKKIISVSHQLKGSAANFGFVGVSDNAAKIEDESKRGIFANVPAYFAAAESAYSQAMAAVAEKYPN